MLGYNHVTSFELTVEKKDIMNLSCQVAVNHLLLDTYVRLPTRNDVKQNTQKRLNCLLFAAKHNKLLSLCAVVISEIY